MSRMNLSTNSRVVGMIAPKHQNIRHYLKMAVTGVQAISACVSLIVAIWSWCLGLELPLKTINNDKAVSISLAIVVIIDISIGWTLRNTWETKSLDTKASKAKRLLFKKSCSGLVLFSRLTHEDIIDLSQESKEINHAAWELEKLDIVMVLTYRNQKCCFLTPVGEKIAECSQKQSKLFYEYWKSKKSKCGGLVIPVENSGSKYEK